MAGDPHEPRTEHDSPQAHANSGQPDALADLLGSDAREAATIAAFDRLLSDGLGVGEAVRKLVADGVLAALDAPGFALEKRGLSLLPNASSRAARKQGKGKKANGKAAANGLSVAEADRLTSWIVEIAVDLGVKPGDIDIRPDGSWRCHSNGDGDGAFALIRHMLGGVRADAWAREWLAAHLGDGPFTAIDDTQDTDSASDSGRLIEIDTVWNKATTATGTIAEDWLTGLGFDKKALVAVAPDICSLRMLDSWWGGQPALVAPITDAAGNMVALHLQSLDPATGAASGQPRNKRGKASWLKDGLIRLGNHGEAAPSTLHMSATMKDALALRAAGMDRVASPLGPEFLGRATVPPGIAEVVVVGPRSEAQQRGLVRLLGQGVQVKLVRIATGATALKPADLRDAVAKADGVLWHRGDDEFFDELYSIGDAEYGRAKLLLKKIPGMVPFKELDKARGAARRKAAIEAELRKQAEEPLTLRAGEAGTHHEAQNLAQLLDDIVALLERYVFLPPTAAWVLALFAVYTGVFDLFSFAMRIWLHSAEPESGKTTAGTLTVHCCPRWKRSDSITEATFHRFIAAHPDFTIFINEANAAIADGGTLVDLICSGFEKGSSVDRTEKSEDGKFTPSSTSPFCPVILAGLEEAAKSVQSRCAIITMAPPLPAKDGVTTRMRRASTYHAEERAARLASRVARWAADNRDAVAKVIKRVDDMEEEDHTIHNGVHPLWISARELDKLLPLFVIAHLAGGDWPQRIEQAARALSPKGRGDLGLSTRLLLDCLDVIHAKREKLASLGGIPPEELLGDLLKEDSGVWQEFADPKRSFAPPQPITAARLGRMLGSYGITRRAMTASGQKRRYYPVDQFLDAFRRYLTSGRVPPDTAAEVARKVAEIDAIRTTSGFSHNKPGNPVRPVGNKGGEPLQTRSGKAQSGPGLKTRKPLRRTGKDRVTGFESEKQRQGENSRRKSPEKRRGARSTAQARTPRKEPETPPEGEDV